MKKITKRQRIKAMAQLWKQYPTAKLGWCGSHFMKGGYLVAVVVSFRDPDLNGRYIWLDKEMNVVKLGKEIDGCIVGYP